MPTDQNHPFEGFSSPTYTQVPDELFDKLLPDLLGAETKVLLYIIRRTFGFKKEADSISLHQIASGILTREGAVLDRGTGLSKDSVARAVKSLEERGVIVRTRKRSDQKGDEPTTYALRMRPVSDYRTPPVGKIGHPPVRLSDTQETVRQQTERHDSNIRNATHEKVSVAEESDGVGPTAERSLGPASQRAPLAISPLRLAKPEQLIRRGSSEPVAIGETLTRRRGRSPGTAEDREVIVAYLADFARELNDQAPLRVSVSRALNLMAQSGLPREAFVPRLYEARSRVKEYSASIQTIVTRNGSPVPVKAKMAYFFAVVADLCGLKADQDSPSPPT
jgi:phage replication O-like protein O